MSTATDPGRLSVRLNLQRDSEPADGAGGYSTSFVTVADVWAQISPVSADAASRAATFNNDITHVITVRWRNDLAAGMRFRKGARVFEIRAVHDPDETARFLQCHCLETN